MSYYLGCSGWSYNHWIDVFYPSNLQRREWLIFYSKYFNSVEVNATFYRFPFTNVVKGWYNKKSIKDNFNIYEIIDFKLSEEQFNKINSTVSESYVPMTTIYIKDWENQNSN